MGINQSILCKLLIVIILLGAQFYPAVAASNEDLFYNEDDSYIPQDTLMSLSMVSQIKTQTPSDNGLDVLELINLTTDPSDSDGDGLPDSVELVLGTDFNNTDSDFDQLDDYNESVVYLSDPLELDSNYDGLADNFEVIDVPSLDVDGDGLSNIWDFDNDDDGVEDNVDPSPFARSIDYETFNFDLKTNGNPVYMDFQLLPEEPDHVRLAYQKWDWPYDNKSTMQDLDNSTDDLHLIPLLELTMDSVPKQSEVEDYGIGISGNRAYVPLFQVNGIGGETALAGKMFYPQSNTTDVHVNASLLWLVQAKTDSLDETNVTIITDTTTIVSYREKFTLTGFSVEESYGSDVGIFYTGDLNQSVASNFMLAYSFLRNNQSTVQDMPQELSSHNIAISSNIESFEHRDLGLQGLTTRMTPNALDSLPDNRVLPIITALQNDFAKKDLSEIDSGSHIVGNDISIDISGDPIISLKTLKTNWYNTADNSPADSDSILSELQDWGNVVNVDEDALSSLMTLAVVWSAGESKVTKIGDSLISFNDQHAIDVVSDVQLWTSTAFLATTTLIDIIANTAEVTYRVYVLANIISKGWDGAMKIANGITKGASSLGKVLSVIGVVMLVIGFALEVGFAIWGFFKIAMSEGWSNTGTFQGAVYAAIMITYAAVMLAIGVILLACGFIPYVGWIIALVGGIILGLIGLVDFILGFFGLGFSDFAAWVVSKFHQTYPNTEYSLDIIDTSLDMEDHDSNGLSAGDRITFKSRINGTITKTADGTWKDVQDSYVVPHYNIRRWMTGDTPVSYWKSDYGEFTNTVATVESYPNYRNTTYEVGAWIEPVEGTVNFPVPIVFNADYKVIYTDRRIEWDFWNGYKYTTMNDTGTVTSEIDMLYFDVLPGNVGDLADWYHISSEDHDYDGLDNDIDPYPWGWDADGDGLSDKFEVNTLGSDPSSSDRDGDGLNDKMELIYGTNLTDPDTDGDNMSDFKEINGWDISFNYSNHTFNMTVHSDPLLPDSDGDGIGDQMEYWSYLNPMSKDTNGDGITDEPDPQHMTYVNFETKWGSEGSDDGEFNSPVAVTVDSERYVYVADSGNHRIQKFDSSGNFITKWTPITGENSSLHMIDIAVDQDDNIYAFGSMSVENNFYSEIIQKFDSNGSFLSSWNVSSDRGFGITSDGHIYIYNGVPYVGLRSGLFDIFNSSGTLVGNMTFTGGNKVFESFSTMAVSQDGYFYLTDGYDWHNNGIFKFDPNGTFVKRWGSEGGSDHNFSWPEALAVDEKGYVYIADTGNHHIQKFSSDGFFVTRWGQFGVNDSEFTNPTGIAIDADENVYISEGSRYWGTAGNRIQKFSQITDIPPRNVSDTIDTDGDGLFDNNETAGWDVTFTSSKGTYTVHVESEPLVKDTDFEGLNDLQEFNSSSNPNDVDTDDDGLSDYVEFTIGTNITHYDTDGDGLNDMTEIIFGSDPKVVDTDGDGLFDDEEFDFGSDPTKEDTDEDDLTDKEEKDFGSNPRNPDTDGDLMFDKTEVNETGSANNSDTDGDGLLDGLELLYNTSARNNDTDKDGIPDGKEVDNRMNPKSNDTDGDGLTDLFEFNNGTDPTNRDTDGNGLNDSEDPYSFATNAERIWVSYDETDNSLQLVDDLERYTNVTVFQPEDIGNYSDKENILFVGRLGTDSSTAGNITMNILASVTPEKLLEMKASDYERFAVEYDVWADNQTVVMLSHPYPNDHYRVLELFKTDSGEMGYPDVVSEFRADAIDKMGLYVMVELRNPVKPSIELTHYNKDELPENMTYGLASGGSGVKYLDINVSENVINGTFNNIQRAMIVIYYTARDLDRTGDLDGNDAGDIDESSLSMIWFNETSGNWEKLTTDMDWVSGVGINTDNEIIDGVEYEGYMWANVSHFSMYGLAGAERIEATADGKKDDDHPLDSDRDGLYDFIERRMGTDPFNQDTDNDGIIDSEDDDPLVSYMSVVDEDRDQSVSDHMEDTQDDTQAMSTEDGGAPAESTSMLFWILAFIVIALLAGFVALRKKE
ncbi:hypothetical protein V7O67_15000 [Methanolobus sp. ZRKC4]|uniref:hypothetical protein n=1 Tax=Methanolobus sp. ZRKC4 TaxID=3125787 RepID=UPI0032510243